MIIGTKELLRRVKEENLIENLSQRELENPEGAGFDLRIGKIYKILENGFLGVSERKTPDVKLLASYKENETRSFVLKPGKHVLVETIEKTNMPDDLVGILRPRITMYRCGVSVHSGACNPGYKGALMFAMHNMSDKDFEIELGSRIIHILFSPVKGGIHRAYEGQWQGGRITTGGKEKQV